MQDRQIVLVEYYMPWFSGGHTTTIMSNKNKTVIAVGFVFRDNDEELVIGLGESIENILHQVSIPKGCIKGDPVELPRPYKSPEVKDQDRN